MIKYIFMTFMIVLLLLVIGCGPERIVKGNLYKLSDQLDFYKGKFAIMPFKSASEGKSFARSVSTDGNAVADILTIQMLYKGYDVVEREKLDEVLEESALKQSGLIESTKEVSDLGRILGADYIVYGSVIQYEYTVEGGDWYISVGVTARIVHVKSGKLVLVCTASNTGNSISEALDGISLAITDALEEDKVYVWQ